MKKVAIYVRVSTQSQEEKNQLIKLREYCEKKDWKIYKEYIDIVSGKEKSRPAFDEMFRDAHRLLFDIVLFWALDRFSRAGTLFTLQKLEELTKIGISWKSYKEEYFDSVGQFKDIVISIMATLAKIERKRISDRTREAFYKDKGGVVRSVKHKKRVGRPKGRKDNPKKPRKKKGYYGKRNFKDIEAYRKKLEESRLKNRV